MYRHRTGRPCATSPSAPAPAAQPATRAAPCGGCSLAHHEYLCTRHGYWIGPLDPSRDDPPQPLAAQVPELTAAQRALHRTQALHGWEVTFDATVVATRVCIELRIRVVHQPLWTRWERRLNLLMPGAYRRPLFMAAIFPEVAALAAVLAAPPGADGLLSDVQRALGYAEPPRRHDVSDALSIWAAGARPAGWYSPPRHTPTQVTITTARRASPRASSQPSGRPPPASAGTGAHHSSPAQDCRCPTPAGSGSRTPERTGFCPDPEHYLDINGSNR